MSRVAWRCLSASQPPHSPGTRSSHSLAVVGSKVYVTGGERTPRHPVDDKLYCFDLAQEEWVDIDQQITGPRPSPRVAPTLSSSGTSLYLFGGRQGVEMGEGALDDLWRIDTTAIGSGGVQWEKVEAKTPPPRARSFHQMVSHGGSLYVFGGCSAVGRLSDVWQYDPTTNEWTELAATATGPKGRGGAGVTAVDGVLYVAAGFIGEEVNDVWAFDVKKRTWQEVSPNTATSSTPTSSTSCVLIKRSVMGLAPLGGPGRLVAFGGEGEPSAQGHEGAGRFLGDTSITEDQGKTWVTLPLTAADPSPRGWYAYGSPESGSSTVSSEARRVVMVVSGGLTDDASRLHDLYVLEEVAGRG